MAENKKIVIKINYDKNAGGSPIKPQRMVTVWHKKRIAMVLGLLSVLIITMVLWLHNNNQPNQIRSEQSAALGMPGEMPEKGRIGSIQDTEARSLPKINQNSDKSPKTAHDKTDSASLAVKHAAAIIFDKTVIRASLNSLLKDNEPYELVTGPIRLAENQTIELFYFNELKGIKHKVFYHNWSKDGKLVYQKQLDVKSKQLKVNSAKILAFGDKGNWQIQLVDKKGKIFSEVNFVVNSE
jgi:hypothetical protein